MKSVTIYTTEGNTYKFNNVDNIYIINNEIHFDYIGVISGKKSKAVFPNAVGYIETEDNKE